MNIAEKEKGNQISPDLKSQCLYALRGIVQGCLEKLLYPVIFSNYALLC